MMGNRSKSQQTYKYSHQIADADTGDNRHNILWNINILIIITNNARYSSMTPLGTYKFP